MHPPDPTAPAPLHADTPRATMGIMARQTPTPTADDRTLEHVGLRLTRGDLARADALAAQFPAFKARAIIRAAVSLGLDTIEADPARLMLAAAAGASVAPGAEERDERPAPRRRTARPRRTRK